MIAPWLAGAWQTIAARIGAGRVPHAVSIAGPAGLGKRELARAFTGSLLCSARRADMHSCGACRACQLVAADSHPDRVFVSFELRDDGTPRTEITVDQIRALSARFAMTSQFGGFQVALVDPADSMNANAANALLKTLEEPGANTVIVLLADRPARLPATIRSRCQRIDVRFPPRAVALDWLASQGIAATDAGVALDLAAGNPGRALEFAQREGLELTRTVARDIQDLGARRTLPSEIAARWVRDEPAERLAIATELIRVAAWSRHGGDRSVPADPIARLTDGCDFHKLAAWWDRANVAREQLKTPLRADLILLEVLHEFRELV